MTQIIYTGLKCDNKECNYHNKDIERKDFESYINSYCPECGDNLLTFKDYMNLVTVEKAVELCSNSFSGENKDENIITVKVNTHETIIFEEL